MFWKEMGRFGEQRRGVVWAAEQLPRSWRRQEKGALAGGSGLAPRRADQSPWTTAALVELPAPELGAGRAHFPKLLLASGLRVSRSQASFRASFLTVPVSRKQ